MKTIKKYLKGVSVFFTTLIILHGCTVFKSAPVTLNEASLSNNKVRVKTLDNQSLEFDRIEVSNNKIFGIKINKGERSMVPIEKDNIEKIQLKDKPTSTTLTVLSIVAGTVVILGIIAAESLDSMSLDLSN